MLRNSEAPAPRSRSLAFAAVLAMALLAPAMAGTAAAQPAPALSDYPAEITIRTAEGDFVFTVEWAVTPQERQFGLMFRQEMAEDHGMVFDFFVEQNVSFWMRNTLIPLDMIFIREDGTVRHIAENTTPLSLDGVPSNGPVRFVLEVVGGTAERLGLVPGDVIELGLE